jgi:hypothetical protein
MKRFVISAIFIVAILGCSKEKEPNTNPPSGRLVFSDHFDRQEIGSDWLDTGGNYRIEKGELRAQGAHNKPLWLKNKLPRDTRIEFDARSMSPAVDIKVEIFGDGKSKADSTSYTATSYVLILGGWSNSRSIIARMDEHGEDRMVRDNPVGVPEKNYHFSIVRQKNQVTWLLDGEKFLVLNDADPLEGPNHEFLAFNNWETEVFFDNLQIFALEEQKAK